MGFIHTRERCLTSNWLGNGSGRCQSWAAAAPVAIWINLGVLFQPFWNMCWAESCDSAQVDFCERCRRWRKNFLCFPFFFSSISLQSSSSLFPLCGCYLFCEEERWNDVTGEKKSVYIVWHLPGGRLELKNSEGGLFLVKIDHCLFLSLYTSCLSWLYLNTIVYCLGGKSLSFTTAFLFQPTLIVGRMKWKHFPKKNWQSWLVSFSFSGKLMENGLTCCSKTLISWEKDLFTSIAPPKK